MSVKLTRQKRARLLHSLSTDVLYLARPLPHCPILCCFPLADQWQYYLNSCKCQQWQVMSQCILAPKSPLQRVYHHYAVNCISQLCLTCKSVSLKLFDTQKGLAGQQLGYSLRLTAFSPFAFARELSDNELNCICYESRRVLCAISFSTRCRKYGARSTL